MITILMSICFVAGMLVAGILCHREMAAMGVGKTPKRDPNQKYPFTRTPALLSELETSVLDILQHEAGRDRLVFCKLQLTTIATIPPRTERGEFLQKLAGSRTLDFVIANASDFSPIMAIQMPGKSDDIEIITDAMKSIKMPLVVLPSQKAYDVAQLHELILKATSKNSE